MMDISPGVTTRPMSKSYLDPNFEINQQYEEKTLTQILRNHNPRIIGLFGNFVNPLVVTIDDMTMLDLDGEDPDGVIDAFFEEFKEEKSRYLIIKYPYGPSHVFFNSQDGFQFLGYRENIGIALYDRSFYDPSAKGLLNPALAEKRSVD